MSNAPTDSAAERLNDARMSLKALFLCVDERVASDVCDKVEAAFLALSTPTAVAEGGSSVGMASASPTPPSPSDGQGVVATSSGGWRPIATAPRDGTRVLAWSAEYGARETYWRIYGEGSIAHAKAKLGEGPDGAWEWHEPMNGWAASWRPTHWMPLPAAPEEGSSRPETSDGEGRSCVRPNPTPLPLAGRETPSREEIRAIVDDAVNSAIPEPWEVVEHATNRLLALLTPGQSA